MKTVLGENDMTKPDDVPQDVWDAALHLAKFCSPGKFQYVTAMTIARAMIAAKVQERAQIACDAEEFGMIAAEDALVTFAEILRDGFNWRLDL